MPTRRFLLAAALVATAALAPASSPSSALAAPTLSANTVLWTSYYANLLGRADQTGGNGATLGAGAGSDRPTGLVVDSKGQRLYWANAGSNGAGRIITSGLDGSQAQVLLSQGMSFPEGLAIDPGRERLYWADNTGVIGTVRLDGSNASTFAPAITGGASTGLAIDSDGDRLFWSSRSRIFYRDLDGTGATTELQISGGAVGQITALAIGGQRIYWVDSQTHTVGSANLDGSDVQTLSTAGTTITVPYGMSIDEDAGRLYLGGYQDDTINYVQLDGSGGGSIDLQPADTDGSNYPVLLQRPEAAGAPQITGDDTWHCSQGEWASDLLGAFRFRAPSAYRYQWERDGSDIDGASTDELRPSEPGSYRCRVTAENYVGEATQRSAAREIAAPPVPPAAASPARQAAPARDTNPPLVTNFAILPARFGVVPRGSTAPARRVRFTVSEAATVIATVQQKRRGRWTTIRTLGRSVGTGAHTMRFSGRIRPRGKGRALRPGSYRMRFRAADRAGNTSPVLTRSFRIVR